MRSIVPAHISAGTLPPSPEGGLPPSLFEASADKSADKSLCPPFIHTSAQTKTGGAQWRRPHLSASSLDYLRLVIAVRSNETLPMTVALHQFEELLRKPLGSPVSSSQFAFDRSVS